MTVSPVCGFQPDDGCDAGWSVRRISVPPAAIVAQAPFRAACAAFLPVPPTCVAMIEHGPVQQIARQGSVAVGTLIGRLPPHPIRGPVPHAIRMASGLRCGALGISVFDTQAKKSAVVAGVSQLNKAVRAPPICRKPVGRRGKTGDHAHALAATPLLSSDPGASERTSAGAEPANSLMEDLMRSSRRDCSAQVRRMRTGSGCLSGHHPARTLKHG